MKSHLINESEFNYEEASSERFYFYNISRGSAYSIGKRDWAPVSTVIGLTYAPEWIKRKIADRLHIDIDSDSLRDWVAANESVIASAVEPYKDISAVSVPEDMVESRDTYYEDVPYDEVEERVMIFCQFTRISMEYLRVMTVAHPLSITDLYSMGCPPEIYRYHTSPVTKNLIEAIDNAAMSVDKAALAWFKNQGFEIDQENILVKISGFEPLVVIQNRDDDDFF